MCAGRSRLHPTALDQSVDDPRQAAPRDAEPVGQVEHLQAVVRGAGQLVQHVHVGQRALRLGPEPLVDELAHLPVGEVQARPRPHDAVFGCHDRRRTKRVDTVTVVCTIVVPTTLGRHR